MRNFQRIFINEKREKENNYDNNFEEKNINEKKNAIDLLESLNQLQSTQQIVMFIQLEHLFS